MAGLRPLLDASSGVMFVTETYVQPSRLLRLRKDHCNVRIKHSWPPGRLAAAAGRQRTSSSTRSKGHRGGLIERPAAVVFRCADAGLASETVFGQGLRIADRGQHAGPRDGHRRTGQCRVQRDESSRCPWSSSWVIRTAGPCARRCGRGMRPICRPTRPAPASSTRCARSCAVERADSLESVSSAHIGVETGLAVLGARRRSPEDRRRRMRDRLRHNPARRRAVRVYATIGSVGEVGDALLECV